MSVAALAVVVPAHDEETLLPVALAAVATAARHPALAGTHAETVVVADACTDRTAAVARAVGAHVVTIDRRNPGAARAAGVRAALRRCGVPATRLRVLTTDADSIVPPGWIAHHLGHARDGWDAVVGTVALPAGSPLAEPHRVRYEAGRPAGHRPWDHPHVHGANLGFGAAAYLAVGGFPPVVSGEDRALVTALVHGGHRVLRTDGCPVLTSPRLRARAVDGFGDYLAALPAAGGAARP
ncbi:glycosyltransferase [Streptomyces lonarensis]|uniref:4,4'-diaponeurosporenoate glycosyltransferase n=1 Tax=Streptomyces lonarensis TaxID=700599 RepID=A0A7X6HYU8_9ACTN|nr:glycosyltransferase [Streptomyces lonarensis]NJQ05594.1 glycosyltransferase [Streptomyces lonarensis]